MAYVDHAPRGVRRMRARERLEYRALVALCFMPCLAVSLIKRVASSGKQPDSMFTEALSSARAAVGYAYLA